MWLSGVGNNFSIKTDPATHTETLTGLRIHSSKAKSSQFTVEVYQTPLRSPPLNPVCPLLLLALPLNYSSSSSLILWLGDICSQHLSDRRGPAVWVLAVVFSERAALEELPLWVEQPAHAATCFGAGVARLAWVQRVHGHLGSGGPCVAALPQGWGVAAGDLRWTHAGAAPEAVAIRRDAAEGGLFDELSAGFGP